MICEISLGKSFFHTISYCLEDKQELSEDEKIKRSHQDGLQHKNRAEVLYYHQCFGNKHELTEQFNEVRKLSKRVEKPVLHLMLRLAPGEKLVRNQLIDIAGEMVKELGVQHNQYLVVEHRDTNEQHIHIVANRVGYNGKAATTSNNFYKMDKLCRRLEKQYQLTEVLSPKQFLPKEMRHLPRHDSRKEKMKADIQRCLQQSNSYVAFAQRMQSLGYQLIKGRGVTFLDEKKMRVKGSDLGFSLANIEKHLQRNRQQPRLENNLSTAEKQQKEIPSGENVRSRLSPTQRMAIQMIHQKADENSLSEGLSQAAAQLLFELMKPENTGENIPQELLKEARKKKKKHRKPNW